MNTKAGIVTVLYNSTRHLEGFVASLLRNSDAIGSVVFVDNNSSDNAEPFLKQLDEVIEYVVIRNIENVGYSLAVNQGVEVLRKKHTQHILVTNNDIAIKEGGIRLLLEDMTSTNSDVIGVPTTNNQKDYVLSNIYDKHSGQLHHTVVSRDILMEKIKTTKTEATTYVQGGVVLFNESFFHKVGIYDPFLFFGGDELDFLIRIIHSQQVIRCSISLRAWALFDHHTYHDDRFKVLKAKMMLQGVVYVLLKHNFGFTTRVFWRTIKKLFIDLGKNNIQRYFVLTFFFIRAIPISFLELSKKKFVNKKD